MKKLFEKLHTQPLYEGLNIRNLQAFKGRGGQPLIQGDLFLNHTSVAFLSEDFAGGCLSINMFDKEGLFKVIKTLGKDLEIYSSEVGK